MGQEYVVYQYDKENRADLKKINLDIDGTVCSEKKMRTDKILRLRIALFALVSRGKYRVLCLDDDKGLVHYSFFMPYCKKFSFMDKKDFQIGPSWTREDYRGQGILGKTLIYISEQILQKHPDANVYALVREANVSSTKGVKKANFKRIGICKKTKYLKHYKTVIKDE